MKPNELMIGDWVEYGQYITTVRHLSDKIVLAGCVGRLDEVRPVPLTPEILEKNGFNIEIAPYTPDWMRCILNPNFFLEDRLEGFYHFNGNNLAKIKYVHELQHALRFCGIKDDIVL